MTNRKSLLERNEKMREMRHEGKTLQEVGSAFGLTHQRVRQILGRDNVARQRTELKIAEARRAIGDKRQLTNGEIASEIGLPAYLITKVRKEMGMGRRPIDRFLPKVDLSDMSKCCEWQGGINNTTGYGTFRTSSKTTGYAHRFSYEYFNGKIPSGLHVLHACDNPLCVNPKHLYAGTPQDNMNDRDSRGRGQTNVLSDKDREAIRRIYRNGTSYIELAALFKVHPRTIYKIVKQEANT